MKKEIFGGYPIFFFNKRFTKKEKEEEHRPLRVVAFFFVFCFCSSNNVQKLPPTI